MKPDFPNDISKIEIDVPVPEPVITIEEHRVMLIKKFNRINIAVFSFLLAGFSAFLMFGKRPVISETENRKLTEFPEFSFKNLVSGTFTNGLADYYNDNVLSISSLFLYTAPVTSSAETDSENSVTQAAEESTVTETVAETAAPVTEAPAPPPEENDGDAGELSNNIMIYKKRGIPIYYGSFENGTRYASIVNEYKQRLGDGVNVFSMVCPTSMSFYWPENSDISHGSEAENLENIKNNLSGVTDINTIPVLNEHKDEHIYSRTDHHWQARGAYYAAKLFAETAGVPFADISEYEEVTVPGYVGTLYGFSGAAVLNDNPEDFVFYRPRNNYITRYYTPSFEYRYEGPLLVEAYGSALYCTFMGSDEEIVHVETDAPNERTLFIIKDSYGNALVPFLTGSYKNIFVVDMRYFNLNIIQFMQEHNATDLLFAMNTFSATGSNFENLEVLLNQ